MVGECDGQLTDGTRNLGDDSVDKDTSDLFDLLDEPNQPATTAVSSAKKKKRNWKAFKALNKKPRNEEKTQEVNGYRPARLRRYT